MIYAAVYATGLAGALTPSALRLAWKLRRSRKSDRELRDLTPYKTRM